MISIDKYESAERTESIGKDIIVIDGKGEFPKVILIIQGEDCRKYCLVKTKSGRFLLNKAT